LGSRHAAVAQQAYIKAIAADTSLERRLALDMALRVYCSRDTEAMIVLARRLCQEKGAVPAA
jgi:hypothetical protein